LNFKTEEGHNCKLKFVQIRFFIREFRPKRFHKIDSSSALLSTAAAKGAIPKRRGSHDTARRSSSASRVESPLHFVDDDLADDDDEAKADAASKSYWRHRKNLRRRPPTPPTPAESGSTDGDLRQRIIDILNSTSNEDCERELSKLTMELNSRSGRHLTADAAAGDGPGGHAADEGRPSGRRRSSGGGARRRRHRHADRPADASRYLFIFLTLHRTLSNNANLCFSGTRQPKEKS
jgi:hypothetical protein